MSKHGYTLVQHSGFGYAGKPGFEQALEVRALATAAERKRAEKAGGIVVDTWGQAEDLAETLDFPPGTEGLYPQFGGTFSSKEVDGLRIAIPKREVVA